MVALAPNTSETSPWDVLDGFPKLHSRAREAKTRICTEVPACKSLRRVEIWLTIYDCRDGLESFTRDPIGYAGSEWDLYEYAEGSPAVNRDPSRKGIVKKICQKLFCKPKKCIPPFRKRPPTPPIRAGEEIVDVFEQGDKVITKVKTADGRFRVIMQEIIKGGSLGCVVLEVVDWTPIGDMKDAWNCGIWIGGGIAGTDPDDQPYVNF